MASKTTISDTNSGGNDLAAPTAGVFSGVKRVLVWSTVVLLAMAAFIVLAGTLAQTEKDIWEVVHEYFRAAWVRIDFQIFFPRSFFPGWPRIPGGIYFPGGWLIGGLLAGVLIVDLALVTIQALVRQVSRSKNLAATVLRLFGGAAIIVLGSVVTTLVILAGANKGGIQGAPVIGWEGVWYLLLGLLTAVWLAAMAAAVVSAILTAIGPNAKRATLLATFLAMGAVLGTAVIWLWWEGDAVRLNDASMRILWQLTKGTFAALVLLAGCLLVYKRKGAPILIHIGILLLMFGELLVGTTAVERRMAIVEGHAVNFVENDRAVELAFIDPSDPNKDDVVVVPGSMLSDGKAIRHDDLPVEIEVVEFLTDSKVRRARSGEKNLATRGRGTMVVAEKVTPGAADDPNPKAKIASVYVNFARKDGSENLGTYLLSQHLSEETFRLDGTAYRIALRQQRDYRPYAMQLIEFRKDDYLGTTMARNFSSDVRVVDPGRNVDRRVRIWMNNPLRFAGETFYQSSYYMDPATGREATVLQVVRNIGWMIPYVACMIVAVGMLVHFVVVLRRFVLRQLKPATAPAAAAPEGRPGKRPATRRFGAIVAAIVVPLVVVPALSLLLFSAWSGDSHPGGGSSGKAMDLAQFGKLPVVYQGRVKPLDTLARNSLRKISDRQTFKDASGKTQPAIRWLLDVTTGAAGWDEHRVFRIHNLQLLDTLGLKRRGGYRYSMAEIRPRMEEFNKQARLARTVPQAERSRFQRAVLALDGKLGIYLMLIRSFRPPVLPPIPTDEEFRKNPSQAAKKVQALRQEIRTARESLAAMEPPLVVPLEPAKTETPKDDSGGAAWAPLPNAWIGVYLRGKKPEPALDCLNAILTAYAAGDADAFNDTVAEYRRWLKRNPPKDYDAEKTDFEAFYNHFAPFGLAMLFYVLALVLGLVAALLRLAGPAWRRPIAWSAFGLLVVGLAVNTYGIWARVYISGRPPITNLYTTAIFIAWGSVVLGLALELIFRLDFGNIIAAVLGFVCLVIAHYLAAGGDTFTVMRAVLDTNFWLFTHVTTIAVGYCAAFVAGLAGLLYIFCGLLTLVLTPKVNKVFGRAIFGILCVAIFFSVIGTVLGGLWADDSWGRFWGWDPKENGALIICLWIALVLHAYWGRLVRERGLAVLAVAGNIVTAWSWFGVNQLGVGLHSYGFTEGVVFALGIFVASQLAIVFIGMLPKSLWWSFRRHGLAEP